MKSFRTYAPVGVGFFSAIMLAYGLWYIAPRDENNADFAKFGVDQTTVATIPVSTVPDGSKLASTAPKSPFDDPLMNEAVRISHLYLDKFDSKFDRWPKATFWVEAILSDGGHKELLWLKVSERVIDGYIAVVDEAFSASNILPKGHPIHLSRAEIVDWRIDRAGTLYGAYTTRVRLSQVNSLAAQKVLAQFKDL